MARHLFNRFFLPIISIPWLREMIHDATGISIRRSIGPSCELGYGSGYVIQQGSSWGTEPTGPVRDEAAGPGNPDPYPLVLPEVRF